jgi:hypothetical protein
LRPLPHGQGAFREIFMRATVGGRPDGTAKARARAMRRFTASSGASWMGRVAIDQLYLAANPGSSREWAIAGQQGHSEKLRERDEGGVVGS